MIQESENIPGLLTAVCDVCHNTKCWALSCHGKAELIEYATNWGWQINNNEFFVCDECQKERNYTFVPS